MPLRPQTPSICLFCRSGSSLWFRDVGPALGRTGGIVEGKRYRGTVKVSRSKFGRADKSSRPQRGALSAPGIWQDRSTQEIDTGRAVPRALSESYGEARPGGRKPPWLSAMTEIKMPMEDAARKILGDMRKLIHDPIFQRETNLQDADAEERFNEFERKILQALDENGKRGAISTMRQSLLDAYKKDFWGLRVRLKYFLQTKIANAKLSKTDIMNQIKLTDLRYPTEWYAAARKLNRVIHLHIGPTNSGKTYHALQRLEQAETGCYAGPLRLLAHEVYTRLNAKGKQCSLITGDEMILPESEEELGISSCTVEMVPFTRDIDVAVIDEIQMIADSSRGWAWTQAVLGIRAKELHLCGEVRSLKLVQEIAASLGEKLVVHNYERLSPLAVAKTGLDSDLNNLQKGDCVVSFSRKVLHGLKRNIERTTGKNVAIVYGALPPEIRAQQAGLFNEQDNNYDILVASDAIGMGLNLSIKRIVFETMMKFDGQNMIMVPTPQIKQIGGRAGRYRTAVQDNAINANALISTIENIIPPKPEKNIGIVTTLHNKDLKSLRYAMESEPDPIPSAGIAAPDTVVLRFSSYFPPGTPFSYILLRLHEICRIHPRYFLCDLHDQVLIADTIQQVDGLTIADRLMLCYAPADTRNDHIRDVLVAYATCLAKRSGGGLLEIPQLKLEILDKEPSERGGAEDHIMKLASTHQAITLYLWLSYRVTSVFHQQALAFHTKQLLQEKLDQALSRAKLDQAWLKRRMARMSRLGLDAAHEENGSIDVTANDPEAEVDVAIGAQDIQHHHEAIAVDDEGAPDMTVDLGHDFVELDADPDRESDDSSGLKEDFIPPIGSSGRVENVVHSS